jgi:hypothetical protein
MVGSASDNISGFFPIRCYAFGQKYSAELVGLSRISRRRLYHSKTRKSIPEHRKVGTEGENGCDEAWARNQASSLSV